MVEDVALVRKRALAEMQHVHEEAAQRRNESDGGDDLDSVWPTQNRLAHQTIRGPIGNGAVWAGLSKEVGGDEVSTYGPVINGLLSKDGPNLNNRKNRSSEPKGHNSKLNPLDGQKPGEKSDEISFGSVKILKG